MIKVKLGDIAASQETLNRISQQTVSGILAYKLGKALITISKELELYDQTRQQLLTKYCEKDEQNAIKFFDNGIVKIKPQHINQYNHEMQILNETQIELNILPLLEKDLEQFNLSPQQMINIDWWIE